MLEKINQLCHAFLLRVNAHKVKNETVIEYLVEKDQCLTEFIDDDVYKRMQETDKIYEIHCYSISPYDFFVVWGTSLEEVMKKAMELLEQNENKKL